MWPNTFILGFPKCGTTALAEIIKQHPDVFVPEKKESRYFQFLDQQPDGEDLVNANVIWNKEEYNSVYTNLKEQVTIDASPGYITSIETINKVVAQGCGNKFVIMLRDPIERVFSHYLFGVQKGFEPKNITFEECLAKPQRKVNGYVREVDYVKDTKYASLVANVLNQIPKERVYICTTERFQREQSTVLAEIVSFFGIKEFEFDINIGEKAKSGVPTNPVVHSLLLTAKKLKNVFPKSIRKSVLKKGYQSLYNSNLEKPKLKTETKEQLKQEFREDVTYIKSLGVDTSLWKNFKD